jgi:branched-chain amino acid transport system substrate-binding protein
MGGFRKGAVLATVTALIGIGVASSTSGGSASASTPKAPTGAPIVLGNIGQYSGIVGSTLTPGARPIQAWAKWVNAHGGINGHPVKVIVEDDQGDPVKSKAAIQKLVEQDHVIAIIASQTNNDSTWAQYVTDKNIPVVGGINYNVGWQNSPFFQSGTDLITTVYNQPFGAKAAGYKSLAAVYCTEQAPCATALQLLKSGADKAGIDLSFTGLAAIDAPSYTAQCLQIKDAGSDIIALGGPNAEKFKQDCARQGVKAAWLLPASIFTVAASKTLGQVLAPVQDFPWFYNGPEAKDFHEAMTKYGHISDAQESMAVPISWVSGVMFQRAIELSGATGLPTTQDVFNGLNKFNNETLGGLAPPLTFGNPRPDNGRVPCYFVAQYKKSKFSLVGGTLKPQCLPEGL